MSLAPSLLFATKDFKRFFNKLAPRQILSDVSGRAANGHGSSVSGGCHHAWVINGSLLSDDH